MPSSAAVVKGGCGHQSERQSNPVPDTLGQVFGSSFNTNGLGGVLTCGVTGVGAGLSHAPVSANSGAR